MLERMKSVTGDKQRVRGWRIPKGTDEQDRPHATMKYSDVERTNRQDTSVEVALESISGSGLDAATASRSRRPVRHGGFGPTRVTDIADAAYVAPVTKTTPGISAPCEQTARSS